MAFEQPNVEIVGICDETPQKMLQCIDNFGIPPDAVFTDYKTCIETTQPDIVLLCPATSRHAEAVEQIEQSNAFAAR